MLASLLINKFHFHVIYFSLLAASDFEVDVKLEKAPPVTKQHHQRQQPHQKPDIFDKKAALKSYTADIRDSEPPSVQPGSIYV